MHVKRLMRTYISSNSHASPRMSLVGTSGYGDHYGLGFQVKFTCLVNFHAGPAFR